MDNLKRKILRLLAITQKSVPNWLKPNYKIFSGLYSKIYSSIYSSINEEMLVRTPFGPLMYINFLDNVEREIANGLWERKYIDFFSSSINKGDIFIDVGAYVGIFSLLASELVGSEGYVYSFEPIPINYERMTRNIELNKLENIKTYKIGLSDKEETLLINVPKQIPAESTLCQNSWTELAKGLKLDKMLINTKMIPFDLFYRNEGLNEINKVKIDVEGAELKVLKGMEKILMNLDDIQLFIEVTPPLVKQLGGSIEKLIQLLVYCGFKTVYSFESNLKIDISRVSAVDAKTFFGNVSQNYFISKEN
jgi:FkbM family methyltransferase